jgi:peptidoglycan/xylan/chitin deacetylase (PgdA/CDA1 family)
MLAPDAGAPLVSPGRAARALAAGSLGRVFKTLGAWRGVLVMNHHRIGDPTESAFDRSLWSSTAESFDGQVRYLAKNADVIVPAELDQALKAKRGRHVMLTFDDGYRDNHEIAYPILREHGVRACFFIATGFLDSARPAWWDEIAWMIREAGGSDETIRTHTEAYKRLPAEETEAYLDRLADHTKSGRCPAHQAEGEWMTWDMVREMRDGGMEIGGHTVTHPVLARETPDRQRQEIDDCAKRLREELDQPMRSFSYPNGTPWSFDDHTRKALREQGVQLAFSFYGGYLKANRKLDRLDVPRCAVFGHWAPADFIGATALPQAFAKA